MRTVSPYQFRFEFRLGGAQFRLQHMFTAPLVQTKPEFTRDFFCFWFNEWNWSCVALTIWTNKQKSCFSTWSENKKFSTSWLITHKKNISQQWISRFQVKILGARKSACEPWKRKPGALQWRIPFIYTSSCQHCSHAILPFLIHLYPT